MRRTYLNSSLTVLALWLSLLCGSCRDDDLYGGETFEEGQPATVSFTLKLADMPEMTRGDNIDENYISDLYVAIFSGDSDGGKRIFSKHYEDLYDDSQIEIIDETHGIIMVKNAELTSAAGARILAIANIANENKAYIDYIERYYTTFTNMKNFTFSYNDPTDVNHYGTTFLMTGWYADSEAKFTKNIETIEGVDIRPGENTLTGAIYLYRATSINKFRIKAGENVSLKINSWQVYNVPKRSYMFEHSSSQGVYRDSYTTSKESHTFATESDGGNTYKTFEFYMLENMHTACDYHDLGTDASGNADWVGIRQTGGLTSTQLYRDREREYKNADGTNSGIYKSLVASHTEGNEADEDLSNNFASYVVVNADIDYYIEDNETNRQDPGGENALPVAYSASAKLIHRTANVDYTIHLGFCKDKDSQGNATVATARDFNCNRNTKYTYNVTINGVKNVVVEATSDSGEPEPGAEGSVYDAYSDEVDLDAHYCEFNISLTDEERSTLAYRITAPYGDGADYLFYVDGKNNLYDPQWEADTNPDKEFFTWIKFYPTTGSDVLAEYDKDYVWSIENLRDTENYPNNTPDSNGEKWYTVFVDEYVYHRDDSGNGTDDSWRYYVNKDNRTVELIKQSSVSADGNSNYSFCKYVFAQKSIQTFYSTSSTTGLGVEHTNETYCMNMLWGGGQSSSRNTTNYSYVDGAHNLWDFAGKRSYKWSNVIDATTPCVVYEDRNDLATVKTHHDGAEYPVYQPAKVGLSTVTFLTNNGYPSPNDLRYFYGNGACLTRNRDLNHNGVIDADEIRWYLPTSSEYIQIAIGQGELPDPLIQFGDHDKNELKNITDREGTYYYHFLTSDFQYFWAEQGVSVGDKPYSQAACQCYTLRCVRQLGTARTEADLNSYDSPVAAAYSHDTDSRTISLDNYNDYSLRGYSLGALAPHTVASATGRPYKKFEYAADVCKNISDAYVSVGSDGILTYADSDLNSSSTPGDTLLVKRTVAWVMSLRYNGICRKYTQEADGSDLGTWRVPNFKELAFMYMENLVQGSGNNYMLSSTYDFFAHRVLWDNATITAPFFGYNDNSNRKVLARDISYSADNAISKIKVRCVRDVSE